MKRDKGNGVVILNKDEYHKKKDEILADCSKFELLDGDTVKLTLRRENPVKAFLKKLKSDNCVTDKTYKRVLKEVSLSHFPPNFLPKSQSQ